MKAGMALAVVLMLVISGTTLGANNYGEDENINTKGAIIVLSLPFPFAPPSPPILKVIVTNIGDADATDIEWSIKWDYGWILGQRLDPKARETSEEIPVLFPGKGTFIGSTKFGFGHVIITAYAECAEGSSDELVFDAMLFGFFLIMQQPRV